MANRDDEEFDWWEHDQMGIWEHQGRPLKVRDLLRAPDSILDLPIEVSVYDGQTASEFLVPMHVDFKGPRDRPAAVVITVAAKR